jgi:serine/threonine-protein kinase
MNNKPESNDLTNQSIGGYSILHRLGVGGMSEVYLAFQESLHRHVALKVLRADFVGSSDHEQRFLQEARAVASLIHPNIVQVYDVGKFDSIHYIAQEYVPGSNLHAYIQRRGALPLNECVSVLWQATAALQKAASIGLVHRDIKPDNLLLTPDGEVKVADFGLARARGQSQNLTAAGVTLGTPLYMSPEQIQGLQVDSRSDLYSLGATAYHMLSGRPPFSGETALALAMQHLQAEPPSLKQLRPDLPDSLVAIVHRLMKKNPDERFASAAELNRELRTVVDAHLEGHIDQMIPFTGLVVENQRLNNLEVTQRIQTLSKQSTTAFDRRQRNTPIFRRVALLASTLALGVLAGLFFMRGDLVPVTSVSTAGVIPQGSIQRQYALAISKNDLRHWRAISELFPPKDTTSINYGLKAELQIARLSIKAENYKAAIESLNKVLNAKADETLLNIARIEMGYSMNKVFGSAAADTYYEAALRSMRQISTAKQRDIKESLPDRIRDEWMRRYETTPAVASDS